MNADRHQSTHDDIDQLKVMTASIGQGIRWYEVLMIIVCVVSLMAFTDRFL